MKKINIQKEILTMDGEPFPREEGKPWTYGKYLSELVLALKAEGSMKKLMIARDLIEKGKQFMEIDNADFAIIKQALKEVKYFDETRFNGLNTLFNGQIEEYLEDLKEDQDKENKKSKK